MDLLQRTAKYSLAHGWTRNSYAVPRNTLKQPASRAMRQGQYKICYKYPIDDTRVFNAHKTSNKYQRVTNVGNTSFASPSLISAEMYCQKGLSKIAVVAQECSLHLYCTAKFPVLSYLWNTITEIKGKKQNQSEIRRFPLLVKGDCTKILVNSTSWLINIRQAQLLHCIRGYMFRPF